LRAGDSAPLIELFQRNHFLVRGYLKNAVGGRVDNRTRGANVFFAELFYDLSPGGRFVTKNLAPDSLLELIDNSPRKTIGVCWEWLLGDDPAHLPMPGCRVFPARRRRRFAKDSFGVFYRFDGEGSDICEPHAPEIWNLDGARSKSVTESVGSDVPVIRGIRHLTYADAIEYHKYDSIESIWLAHRSRFDSMSG
jgi:hypothetical protein